MRLKCSPTLQGCGARHDQDRNAVSKSRSRAHRAVRADVNLLRRRAVAATSKATRQSGLQQRHRVRHRHLHATAQTAIEAQRRSAALRPCLLASQLLGRARPTLPGGHTSVRDGCGPSAGERACHQRGLPNGAAGISDARRIHHVGIGGEFEFLPPVELFDGVHEAEVSLLDEVEKRQA